MAKDESEHEDEQEGRKGGGLVAKFKSEPKWVKIGAIAGVAVLVVTILLFFQNKNQGSNASPMSTDTTGASNGMGASTEQPGEGDIWPPISIVMPPTGGTPTTTPTPTPTPQPPTKNPPIPILRPPTHRPTPAPQPPPVHAPFFPVRNPAPKKPAFKSNPIPVNIGSQPPSSPGPGRARYLHL